MWIEPYIPFIFLALGSSALIFGINAQALIPMIYGGLAILAGAFLYLRPRNKKANSK